jgi:23S rRNA (uracil1939-C5)-methyltransferase
VPDPPIAAAPERIVCVSGKPATLARDLAILREGVHTLESVQPLDRLPRTYHVQSESVLTRRVDPQA